MDALRPDRPPDYTAHSAATLQLPAVSSQSASSPSPNISNGHSHSLSRSHTSSQSPQSPSSHIQLPAIKSLHLPASSNRPAPLQHIPPPSQWAGQNQIVVSAGIRTLPPPTPNFATPTFAPGVMTLPMTSPIDANHESDVGVRIRQQSIVSLDMDDPETREAAETLSGLRNMDFHRPTHKTTIRPLTQSQLVSHMDTRIACTPDQMMDLDDEPEPLLSLITSTHPWIGGTINTGVYAYNSTIQYSPNWVQNVLEKNIQTVANGLESVSRVTGADRRLREYLGDTPERRTSRATASTAPGARRSRDEVDGDHEHAIDTDAMDLDVERGPPAIYSQVSHSRQLSSTRSRTGSQASFDTLPAYDENRAPEYEKAQSSSQQVTHSRSLVQPGSQAWSTRLMITTSGLGAALSDRSLSSLKHCLKFLRGASSSLAEIMHALQSLIAEFEQYSFGARRERRRLSMSAEQEDRSRRIAEGIKEQGAHIIQILQDVTNHVSTYAGSALPENAGALVRRQLMSVPQRWKIANESTSSSTSPSATSPSTTTPSGSSTAPNGSVAAPSNGDVEAEKTPAEVEGQRNEMLRAGQRWLVFAEQGCDMITQVGLVLSGTVDSAEEWLDRMGRRRASTTVSAVGVNGVNGMNGSEKISIGN